MNTTVDPKLTQPIFNQANVVTKGWYVGCRSAELPIGKAKSLDLCGQRIVLYRGADAVVRALDAYCPHLGTDLGLGRVDGNHIRCFFHHWAFDPSGECQDIPCGAKIPSNANVRAYATDEKYGLIWIYPDRTAPTGVAEFDELRDRELVMHYDTPLERGCHHHICMMNGIDAQHLQTVHGLSIDMQLDLQADPSAGLIDFTMSGAVPDTTAKERLIKWFLGEQYCYSMRYAYGCLGLLTMMKGVKWVPPLHMLYAYMPIAGGQRTRILPIYVTAKRTGIFGWLTAQFLLVLTRLAYYFLRDEDGQVYDNIRFAPNALLAIDAPLVRYMQYVNQLEPSCWSQGEAL
ncbi:aromatic ring-hydroxylating dioxygenase subunit alpha [filamentous cyanobacterium LEGE 11480]|uniref:Aromatic ring-hydroxylating dioxygenase subunit alpha n=1 Tax=Romeriopsis navalis LEGE 11480 TaxID=2777977 RepID=A0A928VJW0_9CYAN|nr:aromatic ring-hydroxylating dioxygenase subunit alpha [Romeriopsis navalis]MBE9029685.1 aromatic ring-hydroxylating dioxygenase subunit alpha [Romeriopsis navalis LEGE 11480]